MKQVIVFTLTLLFTVCNNILVAQISFGSIEEGSIVSFQTKELEVDNTKTDGSPYVNENFEVGQILVNNDRVALKGELRYNAFTSEIELKQNEKEYTAILKRGYISARIGEKIYKILPYVESEELKRTAYFVPLNAGKVVLLFKPEIILRRGKTPSTSYGRIVPPRYINVSSYYLKIADNPAKKIYLNKKSIFKELNQELSKQILKNNDFKLRKEEGALKFLELYNQKLVSKE